MYMQQQRWGRALVAALAFGAVGGIGEAPALADKATRAAKAEAKQHYALGLRAYNTGEFDSAIEEWKQAYTLLGAPDFLFNIAQAYRQKRNYDQAIFFYNGYLRGKPDADNFAEVTALRDEMVTLRDKQLANAQMPPKQLLSVGEPPVAGPVADPGVGPVAEPEHQVFLQSEPTTSTAPRLRKIGIVAGVSGVALAAAGTAFLLSAGSTEAELEMAASNLRPWSMDFADKEAQGTRDEIIGAVLLGSGIVAMSAGLLMYYRGKQHETLLIAPSVGADGASLELGVTF